MTNKTQASVARELLPVTQEDREAAAPILRLYGAENYAAICEAGVEWCDRLDVVQAFARHRIQALSTRTPEGDMERLKETGIRLALCAGKLNVALHAHEEFKLLRMAVTSAMDEWAAALASLRVSGGAAS